MCFEDQDATTQVEFTQGRAKITLPFDIAPRDGPDRSIEAVWRFDLPPGSGTGIRKWNTPLATSITDAYRIQ